MIRELLREGQLRGYSADAWKARHQDLLIHEEAYTIGIKIATRGGKVSDIKALTNRRREIQEEIDRSYL